MLSQTLRILLTCAWPGVGSGTPRPGRAHCQRAHRHL